MHLEFDVMTKDWMLGLMKRAKFLRPLLPAWHAPDKAFRDWYIRLVEAYPGAAADDGRWAKALGLSEQVRGYREIRYQAMAGMREQVKALVGDIR